MAPTVANAGGQIKYIGVAYLARYERLQRGNVKTGYLHIDGNEALGRAPARPHHWSVAILVVIVAQWLLWQGSGLGSAAGALFDKSGVVGVFGPESGYLVSGFIYLLIPFAIIVFLAVELTRKFDDRRANALGLDRRTMPLALIWAVAGLVAATPLVIATAMNSPPLDRVLQGVLVLTPVTIVQAGAEEILFRGVIMSFLAARYGVRTGLIGSALLFGLWHVYFGQPWADFFIKFVWTFVFGLTAGLVTLHYANLGPALALHIVWNVTRDIHGASYYGDSFWTGWVTVLNQVWSAEDIASGAMARFLVLPLVLETLIVFAACRETLNRLLSPQVEE